jgi:peroxiredoxin
MQGNAQVRTEQYTRLEEEETKTLSDSIEVVVFLSETCPICRQSIKTLNKLFEKYTALGVAFTGVFPSPYISTAETRKAFAKKNNITFPLVPDPGYKITDSLQAAITPEVFIRVIKTGKVMYQGKIDNMFEEVGKRRQVVTKHYVEDALMHILQGTNPDIAYTDAIGCFITR